MTEVIFKLPNTVIGYAILPSATILSYFVSRGSMIRENILSIVIPAFNNQTSLCCLSKRSRAWSLLCMSERWILPHPTVIVRSDLFYK